MSTPVWVVLSGKMYAGKDTIADLLIERAPLGATVKLGFGDLMRAELALILATARSIEKPWGDFDVARATDLIAARHNLEPLHARDLLSALLVDGSIDPDLTPRTRTVGTRFVLQELGSTWRTASDESYWARQMVTAALAEVAAGRSVVSVGGRFLPDVELPRVQSAELIRLDLPRSEQLVRMVARDGIEPTAAALAALDHPGEIALDDYAFPTRIDAAQPIEDVYGQVLEAVVSPLKNGHLSLA